MPIRTEQSQVMGRMITLVVVLALIVAGSAPFLDAHAA